MRGGGGEKVFGLTFTKLLLKDLFMYLRRGWRGEQGERKRESQKDSVLNAEPNVGLDLTILTS